MGPPFWYAPQLVKAVSILGLGEKINPQNWACFLPIAARVSMGRTDLQISFSSDKF